MAGRLTRHPKKVGLPPGTLMHVGEKRVAETAISVIDYDETVLHEEAVATPEECRAYLDRSTVTWINLTGLHDTTQLERFGETFGIHPLVLEDILNTNQRPKLEEHESYMFVVLKMLYRNGGEGDIVSEQVSFILGENYLLSFQEMEGDVFGIIRDRIRTTKGRIRKLGCDYLTYALLDAIVDHYFVVLEDVGDRIEELQDQVLDKPDPEIVPSIHRLKREMIFMRKNLWPLRELVSGLEKSDSTLIEDSTRPYLRDVYEHTVQVIDSVESLRDALSTALDIYMSTVSNRMNEVMKVLTVIATIFMPLTFVAGIYGMNFEHMPELKWRCGYALVWLVLVSIGTVMVVFFKRRRWL